MRKIPKVDLGEGEKRINSKGGKSNPEKTRMKYE